MNIKSLIDYTLLRPALNFHNIDTFVQEAINQGYYSVCIPPYFLDHINRAIEEDSIKLCSVIGFPNGFESYKSKVEEIKEAISDGADELDAVLNLAAVKNEKWNYVDSEIDSLVSICRLKNAKLKLIVENELVSEDELKRIVEIAIKHSVEYIKTATGVNGKTTPEFVSRLREIVGDDMKIKASGGINTLEEAEVMITSGADRIGTSSLI
ncbi:deoxyribose-phosphate aldolase [Membranihabitans maritimus]|uniref:deoxyribose-phosphate aldolase n=1 Tax=Membranihabitans maritimus TaxID=2904244 RepID=UPI001F015FF3|nr:deoxyribose-phosphate aldolase [Membranihabitans maritimus]